jgi:putative ABC transport system permease protein
MVIEKGRFLNESDMKARRKVIVINKQTEETLFKGEDPLGKYIVADDIAFQVVGVYDRPMSQGFGGSIYIPLSVGKLLFDRGWGIRGIEFTVRGIDTEGQADALTERIRAKMGPYLGFDPTDTSAMYVQNTAKMAVETQKIFGFINMFLWVIGFACIMAGIVGVGNIMLVTVKERTREIGIRKAIGATPWSIIKMVIIEAIFITTVAGYTGIVLGIGLTELISRGLEASGGAGNVPFKDPTVGLGIVFAVLAILVACGVVAGLIPSLKATRIRPIEAMRAD